MANLEIEGRIARKLNVQSGRSARGEWFKQEFILEFQDGNFTSNAVFSVWGEDKVKDLEAYEIGRQVKVSFQRETRFTWKMTSPPVKSSAIYKLFSKWPTFPLKKVVPPRFPSFS